MEQKKKAPLPVVRALIQNAIRRERRGWPPDTPSGLYQPQRPEAFSSKKSAQADE